MKSDEPADECRTAAALYSIGALPPDEAFQFEQRLASGCPLCTSEFAAFSEVAAYLGMDAPLQTPPPYLRQRILDQIAAISAPSSAATPPEATLVRAHDSPWASTPAPGVSARPLLGDRTVLIRMQPGAAYPSHEHSQAEQCYVIEGTLTDSDGFTVYAGDFVCMPAGSTHKPIHSDSGCLLLVAYTA